MTAIRPHHNRRLRKKLHLGEFQELGFSVSATCPPGWGEAERDRAMLELLAVVEARGLVFGGGDSASGMDGHIGLAQRGSPTEDDRLAIEACLNTLGFTEVRVSPLEDAWYPPEDSGDD
jgi:uncharacterized protein YggL (DUF469 family)